MTEVQSYIFDFRMTPRFMEEWNLKFTVNEMKSSSNLFQIVYCDLAPSNINNCLNGGVLDSTNVNVLHSVDFSLKYEDGIISVREDASWNLSSDIKTLKAIFVRHKGNGFVMGYSINTTPFEITNTVKLEKGTILWSITDGE